MAVPELGSGSWLAMPPKKRQSIEPAVDAVARIDQRGNVSDLSELSDLERSVNANFTKRFEDMLVKILADPAFENIQNTESTVSNTLKQNEFNCTMLQQGVLSARWFGMPVAWQ